MLTFPGRTTNEETEGQGYCNKGAIKTRISKQSQFQFQFQFVARYKKLLALSKKLNLAQTKTLKFKKIKCFKSQISPTI